MTQKEFYNYRIIVRWYVDGVLVNTDRPFFTEVMPCQDFTLTRWNDMSEGRKHLYIKVKVEDDFSNRVACKIEPYKL